MDRLGFVPPSAEISPPLRIRVADKSVQQTGLEIEIGLSHFHTEAIYFHIGFSTPAGTLTIDPEKHFSYCMNLDMDNIVVAISEGLKNNLPRIVTGCKEPLFDIEILRCPNGASPREAGHLDTECDEFQFAMSVDVAKILSDTSASGNIRLTMTVDTVALEELVSFFVRVGDRYAQYREAHKESFDEIEEI